MIEISALIAELQQKKISLQVIHGQLKVEAPNEALTETVRKTITERKAEIIAFLAPSPIIHAEVKPNTLTHSHPGKTLSIAQRHLWSLMQQQPGHSFFNVKQIFTVAGRLNPQALQTAFDQLMQRHEILRCKIGFLDNEPRLVPDADARITVQLQDLSQLTGSAQSTALDDAIAAQSKAPFNLEIEFPCRVAIITLSSTKSILVIVLHHLAMDNWSGSVLRRELSQLYVYAKTGIAHSLPKLTVQFPEFSLWQQHWLTEETLQKQLSFWRKELQDLNPTLQLPTDFPQPTTANLDAGVWIQDFDVDFLRSLRLFSRTHNVTVFMALMVALQILFYRLSNQQDFAVVTPVTQRQRQDVENLLGYFVNPLLIRTTITADDNFLSILSATRKRTIAALNFPHLPFNLLVEELFPQYRDELNPLAQVFIAMQNQANRKNNWGDLQVDSFHGATTDLRYNLEIHIREENGELQLTWLYRRDLWVEATLQQWGKCLHTLLANGILSPSSKISTLAIQAPETEQRIMQQWSIGNVQPMSNHCLHQLFEQQVTQNPEAIAVYYGQQTYSYRELDQRSNQLAHHILGQNLSIETPIALCLDQSVSAILALLAAFKSGCAALPLATDIPAAQLNLVLHDAQPGLVITQQNLSDKFTAFRGTILVIDTVWQDIQFQPKGSPERIVSLKNLALVQYVAAHKGAMIEHYALNNALKAMQKEVFKPRLDDQCLSLAPLNHESALLEIFLPLISGAALVIPEDAITKDLEKLKAFIQAHPLRLIPADPSIFLGLSMLGWVPEAGQTMFAHGARLSRTLALSLLQPATNLWQLFGVPEATLCSLVHHVNAEESTLLLGTPLSNTEVFILDAQLQPVAIGIWGEMYLGGLGLARGYLHHAEVAQHCFIAHPFSNNPAARLFKTNIKVRWLSEGQIEFGVRLDKQVFIGSLRVNLTEIENCLQQHAAIQQVTVALEGECDDPILVSYFIAHGNLVDAAQLRQEFSAILPLEQIPKQFIPITSFPRTASGQPDFQALATYRATITAATTPNLDGLNATAQQLLSLCADIFNPAHAISLQDTLFSVGGSKIQAIRLQKALQSTFALALPLSVILDNTSFGELVEHVIPLQSQSATDDVLVKTDNLPEASGEELTSQGSFSVTPAIEDEQETLPSQEDGLTHAAETIAVAPEAETDDEAGKDSSEIQTLINEITLANEAQTLDTALPQTDAEEVDEIAAPENQATATNLPPIPEISASTSIAAELALENANDTSTVHVQSRDAAAIIDNKNSNAAINQTDSNDQEEAVIETEIADDTAESNPIIAAWVNEIPLELTENEAVTDLDQSNFTNTSEPASEEVLAEPSQFAPNVPEEATPTLTEASSVQQKLLARMASSGLPRVHADSLLYQFSQESELPSIYLCGGAKEIAPHCHSHRVFGLETACGLMQLSPENIRSLAADYVREILAHNPQGPYRVGGYEMGTLIAFEIALQLQAQGKSVDMLLLIDQIVYQPYSGPIAFFILQQNQLLRDLLQPGSTKVLHKYFSRGWTVDIIPGQHTEALEYVPAMVLAERISARTSPNFYKPLAKAGYQLQWELLGQEEDATSITLSLNIKNTSHFDWPAGQMAIGHHLQDLQGVLIEWARDLMTLKESIPAGHSKCVNYSLNKPVAKQNVFIIIDLLDRAASWFSLQGTASYRTLINTQLPDATSPPDLAKLAALHDQGNLHQTIPLYETAIEAYPEKRQELALKLAQAYLRSGRAESAGTILAKTIAESDADQPNNDLKLLLAEIYVLTGGFANAISAIEAILAEQPNHPQALGMLALANAHAGHIIAAKQAMDRVLDLYSGQPLPSTAMHQIDSFNFILDKFHHPDSIKYAQLLLDNEPLHPDYSFNYAYFLFRRKLYQQAEELLLRAIEHYPSNPIYQNNLAKLYLEQEKFTEAANIYRQLTKLAPLKIENYVMLAKIRLHLEQYQAAMDILEHALKLNPEDTSVLKIKAEVKAAKHQ